MTILDPDVRKIFSDVQGLAIELRGFDPITRVTSAVSKNDDRPRPIAISLILSACLSYPTSELRRSQRINSLAKPTSGIIKQEVAWSSPARQAKAIADIREAIQRAVSAINVVQVIGPAP